VLRHEQRRHAPRGPSRSWRREASQLLGSRVGFEGFGDALAPPNRGRRYVGESLSLRHEQRRPVPRGPSRLGHREASQLLGSREGFEGVGDADSAAAPGSRHLTESLFLRHRLYGSGMRSPHSRESPELSDALARTCALPTDSPGREVCSTGVSRGTFSRRRFTGPVCT